MATPMPLVREFPPEVAGVAKARSAVRTWLEEGAVPEPLHTELMLAGTELFTEAIERGCRGPIVLRAWTDDGFVVLELNGGQPGVAAAPKVRSLWDHHRHAGDLRMSILAGVCDEVSRSTRVDSHRVRCRKRIA